MRHSLAGNAGLEARVAKEIEKARRFASVRLSDPSMQEAMRVIEGSARSGRAYARRDTFVAVARAVEALGVSRGLPQRAAVKKAFR